jgi:aspartate-semialdehyde dehydrogenase
MNVGVVGATGMVGEVFMNILGSRKFPVTSLRPFASEKSEGLKIQTCGREWAVEALRPNCFQGLDIVFFSSGDDISAEWAPQAVAAGAFAIDNSAAFRMHKDIPLVVPEVNAHEIPPRHKPGIIANPNCSTIQLVVALHALRKFDLKEVRVASYQSVSGAGKAGRDELLAQTRELLIGDNSQIETRKPLTTPKTFTHEIAFNCIPQIGSFNDKGYCSEEVKIMNETRKILGLPGLRVSAFTVRIPSLNSHSEAVWVTFDRVVSPHEIFSALESGEGLQLISQTEGKNFPTARQASGQDPVYVGRVHQDLNDPHTWLMWIVADNILKGAALNGIQIAERILKS